MKLFKNTLQDWLQAANERQANLPGSDTYDIKNRFSNFMVYSFRKTDEEWQAYLQIVRKKVEDASQAQNWQEATEAQKFLNYQLALNDCREMLVEAGWAPPPAR